VTLPSCSFRRPGISAGRTAYITTLYVSIPQETSERRLAIWKRAFGMRVGNLPCHEGISLSFTRHTFAGEPRCFRSISQLEFTVTWFWATASLAVRRSFRRFSSGRETAPKPGLRAIDLNNGRFRRAETFRSRALVPVRSIERRHAGRDAGVNETLDESYLNPQTFVVRRVRLLRNSFNNSIASVSASIVLTALPNIRRHVLMSENLKSSLLSRPVVFFLIELRP
jgi:hypothetical protein